MKKVVVIYDSKFGNTEKVPKALAYGMREQGVKVNCLNVKRVEINKLKEYDLLAILTSKRETDYSRN